ncbi:hypothetical protein [Parachlamydia acanthamoebae]|jgi:hypothetical protein|uniref:hypothetical protein n=1 Tax=Parachlamydia acanthamoebae TaxID=83552 RepID=UPI0001C1780F|nr:hypothetical protein [Parachlamydia acanthamoebae]EFB42783.1 hypothetical protein pah_c002o020 [Parachlamydia acanthamoebae str. Hall's coccus]
MREHILGLLTEREMAAEAFLKNLAERDHVVVAKPQAEPAQVMGMGWIARE